MGKKTRIALIFSRVTFRYSVGIVLNERIETIYIQVAIIFFFFVHDIQPNIFI